MKQNQNDRVSFSFGMKLSLPTKYESADFHVSMTSDVEETESTEGAFNRVKNEVNTYVNKLYSQIRESETGLLDDKLENEENVQTSAQTSKQVTTEKDTRSAPRDRKLLRKQIKEAFLVLEAQKKVTKSAFKAEYLSNKKIDELSDMEVEPVFNKIIKNFPELGLT